MSTPYFDIPLNLPHAGKVAVRIRDCVVAIGQHNDTEYEDALALAERLVLLLNPWKITGENPAAVMAEEIREEAAFIGRGIVEEIESEGFGYDRLGQCIRNLFECLALGKEGAEIGLRAGEDPNSIQRPV